jgi:hypothetical protein
MQKKKKPSKTKTPEQFRPFAMWATWTMIQIRPFGNLVTNGRLATVNFKP